MIGKKTTGKGIFQETMQQDDKSVNRLTCSLLANTRIKLTIEQDLILILNIFAKSFQVKFTVELRCMSSKSVEPEPKQFLMSGADNFQMESKLGPEIWLLVP